MSEWAFQRRLSCSWQPFMLSRRLGRASAVAILAALFMGASKCSPASGVTPTRASVKASTDPQADSADQVAYGVHAVLTANGITRGIMDADRGYSFEDGTRLELRGIRVTFVDSVGVKGAVMTARQGTHFLLRSRLESRGQVVVAGGAGGRQLQTERLVFDLSRNVLVGDTVFALSDSIAKRKTTGAQFELDPKLMKPAKPRPSAASTPAIKPAPTKPASAKSAAPGAYE